MPENHRSPQAPPSFTTTPESLTADTQGLIRGMEAIIDQIVATVLLETATFENVVLPVALKMNESSLSENIIGFYQHVSPHKNLRDASAKAEEIMNKFSIKMYMRRDMYTLVDAVYGKREVLDAEAQRLLEKERGKYIKNGASLPTEGQDRFIKIKEKLSRMSIDSMRNLNEENTGIWFPKEELAGVPDDVLQGLEKGTGENNGKLKVSFQNSELTPILNFALNWDVRRQLLIGNQNKCNENVPLFREAIILRDEAARMLGYPNHASFRIKDLMAPTPGAVLDFLNDLQARLKCKGLEEIEHLKNLKKQDFQSRGLGASYDGTYYIWDDKFYNRLMIEREYSVDQQKVADYFPLLLTVERMLRVFEKLFGLNFDEIVGEKKSDDIVWHKDVLLFSVWDDEEEGGAFSGYLYLDLYPRPGKYGHAAQFSLQPGFLYPDGIRRYPATALVCNFSKPMTTKPSLLKHNELVTLFHELGHGIHDLVGRTTYSSLHGTSVVRDFVEAPSKMLENWCWIRSVLKDLSNHYETGEQIADDLIKRLIQTRHVNLASHYLARIFYAKFDSVIHTPQSHEAAKSLNIPKEFNMLRTEITGLRGPENPGWGNGHTIISHFNTGYDGCLYGYLYSDMISAIIFGTHFVNDPMNSKEGRRYKHMVLEKGGSLDERVILRKYMGRELSSKAFYKMLGLSEPSSKAF